MYKEKAVYLTFGSFVIAAMLFGGATSAHANADDSRFDPESRPAVEAVVHFAEEVALGDNASDESGSLELLGSGETRDLASVSVSINNDQVSKGTVFTAQRLDESGTRFTAILLDDQSTPSWTFANAELNVLDDGRVTVVNEDGSFLAGVEAPWAVDANGKSIPTTFRVDGDRLIQDVDTSADIAFPVVADPTVRIYPGYYQIGFNKSESIAVTGTVATCAAALSKSPHPAGKAFSIACTALAAINGANLAGGKCLTVHIAGVPPTIGTWWPTYPKCK